MGQQVNAKQALRLLPEDYASVQMEEVPPTPEQEAENAAILAQAATEGVKLGKIDGKLDRTVPFMGERFRIANKVGLMPLIEFAHHAQNGADTGDMGALVAIRQMLHDCIDGPEEWERFREHATAVKADAEDLLAVVGATIELLTAKKEKPVSGSSVSLPDTPQRLTDNSSGRVSDLVPVTELGKVSLG